MLNCSTDTGSVIEFGKLSAKCTGSAINSPGAEISLSYTKAFGTRTDSGTFDAPTFRDEQLLKCILRLQ